MSMMAAIRCGQREFNPPPHDKQQQHTRPRRVLRRTKLFMRRRLGMARQDHLFQVPLGPLPRMHVLEKPDHQQEEQQEQQEQQEPTENE
jgi:hypothetical protein